MQENCFDYYELEENNGCCLKCSYSEQGCLCYECKCSNCYWYRPPEKNDGTKGICDLVQYLKDIGRRKTRIYHLKLAQEEFKLSLILEKRNKEVLQVLKEGKIIPNFYTCQKCKRSFVTLNEHKIFVDKLPVCDICSGVIQLTFEQKSDCHNKAIELFNEEEDERKRK